MGALLMMNELALGNEPRRTGGAAISSEFDTCAQLLRLSPWHHADDVGCNQRTVGGIPYQHRLSLR